MLAIPEVPVKRLAYGLFFISGLTSLIYEVVWMRLLTLTFGAAAFAIASVLLAYMSGLCAGSFCFGRLADRCRRHLRLYACLELLIGLYALLLPFVLERAGSLYVLIFQQFEPGFYPMSLIRLLCSTLVLGVPTFLMGGTLPLLAAAVTKSDGDTARRVAALYSLNTLGAVAGCLLAGYLLIPHLGLTGTTLVASSGNAMIFLVVIATRQRPLAVPSSALPKAEPRSAMPPASVAAALGCFAISGLAAMAYQAIWTRLLSMIIGTTVYAFTVILAAFLLGLVLGSALYRGWLARRPFLALSLTQLGVGLFVLGTMPFFDQLPFVFLKIFAATQSSWPLYQIARLVLAIAVLLLPTTCFGIAFPLVVEITGTPSGRIGRVVGNVYSINTFGAIVGSFTGGFVLIPFLGLQKGLLILATLNLLCGLTLVLLHPSLRLGLKTALSGGAIVAAMLGVIALKPWNLHYINSGPYIYAHDYNHITDTADLKRLLDSYDVRFFREDATASVSVLDILGTLSLAIDGKTDASTGGTADMSTQILLTELPAMLAQDPHDALLVGLGSGVSLGSLLRHDLAKVDVLEISEAVVEASRYFQDYNFNALSDPRVNLVIGDGRHHLQRTPKSYDLIISQPSNPWITGVSSLFTTEYYRLMHDHVRAGGLVCQWIPSYHMSEEMLAVILKSFTTAFPYATLWTSSVPGDLFVIGSDAPLVIDFPSVRARLARQAVREDLARIKMDDPMLLVKTFKFDEAQVRAFIARHAATLPENTDLNPIVEFMTPQFLLNMSSVPELRRREQLTGDLPTLLAHINFEADAVRRGFIEDAERLLRR